MALFSKFCVTCKAPFRTNSPTKQTCWNVRCQVALEQSRKKTPEEMAKAHAAHMAAFYAGAAARRAK